MHETIVTKTINIFSIVRLIPESVDLITHILFLYKIYDVCVMMIKSRLYTDSIETRNSIDHIYVLRISHR